MKHLSNINYFFVGLMIASDISLFLSTSYIWTIITLIIMAAAITGYVVTDVCIDLVERDIAELLKKAKK